MLYSTPLDHSFLNTPFLRCYFLTDFNVFSFVSVSYLNCPWDFLRILTSAQPSGLLPVVPLGPPGPRERSRTPFCLCSCS